MERKGSQPSRPSSAVPPEERYPVARRPTSPLSANRFELYNFISLFCI